VTIAAGVGAAAAAAVESVALSPVPKCYQETEYKIGVKRSRIEAGGRWKTVEIDDLQKQYFRSFLEYTD
jgi:hypothetical protein